MYDDFETNMLTDAPLQTFLKEKPNIEQIWFCQDNARTVREADCPPPEKYKDYNEWLVGANHELVRKKKIR